MRNGEIGAEWVCSVSLMGLNSYLARIDGEIQLLALFPVLAATPTIEARRTSALRGQRPGRGGKGRGNSMNACSMPETSIFERLGALGSPALRHKAR